MMESSADFLARLERSIIGYKADLARAEAVEADYLASELRKWILAAELDAADLRASLSKTSRSDAFGPATDGH